MTKSSRIGPARGDEPTVVLAERVTKVRRSDGVYYSTPPAAALVAALALSPEIDHGRRRLRIVDPACGAGALLAACGQVLQRRRFSASGIQNTYAIAGFDIDPDAVGAASAAVSSAAPQAATEWRTFQHGPQAQGAAAGALELLAGNTFPLLPRGRGGYDIVVMNPPFTRNEVRGEKFETSTRDAMRQRERALRDHLRTHDPAAAAAVNPNSIQTFFVVLADFLASRTDARVVIIVPTTAATSAGVRAQRVFLADRFVVECVITSHDQDLCAFSAGSGVFESVIVCRRRGMRELPADTSFVALRRAPRTVGEAEELAARLQKRQYGSYESVTAWPAWRVAAGDWTPCQWYDGRLAATAAMLEAHPALLPLGRCASLGPKEGNVRHSWLRVEAPAAGRDPRARRVVGGVGGPSQTALQGAAQQWMIPGNGRAHLWDRFDARSSCLLVAERYDVLRGVLTAMWVSRTNLWPRVATRPRQRRPSGCSTLVVEYDGGPPASSLAPGKTPDLSQMVDRASARHAGARPRRYGSAQSLHERVRAIAATVPAPAARAGCGPRSDRAPQSIRRAARGNGEGERGVARMAGRGAYVVAKVGSAVVSFANRSSGGRG